MANITKQKITESGIQVTFTAVAGGGDLLIGNTGRQFLTIDNRDAASKTVTIAAENTSFPNTDLGEVTKADIVVTVPANQIYKVGPLPPRVYNNINGAIAVTYSAATNLFVAFLEL